MPLLKWPCSSQRKWSLRRRKSTTLITSGINRFSPRTGNETVAGSRKRLQVDPTFLQTLISLPRATVTADLLTAVRDVIVSDKYVEAKTWPTLGMLHALFLLWHLDETEAALDALLEVLRSDDEYQEFLFGIETETWLRGILDLLGKKHPEKLVAFVREPYRNSYVRSTVMHASWPHRPAVRKPAS